MDEADNSIYSIQRDLESQFEDAEDEDFSIGQLNLDITAPPRIEWFHGQMSREEASRILGPKPPSSFLVRESITHVGDYIISFRVQSGVKHFKIISHELGDFFIADLCFSSLDDVVENFYHLPLSDGMVLQHPVPPFSSTQLRAVERTVIAMKTYHGLSMEELSFQQGDRLKVLQGSDPVWFFCEHEMSKQQGWAPAQLLHDLPSGALEKEAITRCQLPPRFQRKHWLHGRISSEDAKNILASHHPGAFLIRESASTPGNFTLSFHSQDAIEHFRIAVVDFMDYQLGGRHFGCLEDIVLHYMQSPLTSDLTLKQPVAAVQSYGEFDVEGAEYSDPDSKGVAPKPKTKRDAADVGKHIPGAEESGATIMSGYLTRKENKSCKWKSMFFSLEPAKKYLHVFESESAVKPKRIFDLPATSLYTLHDSYHGRPYCFQLVLSSSCVDICCDNDEERLMWMRAIYPYCFSCNVVLMEPNPLQTNRITNLYVTVREIKGPLKAPQLQCQLLLNEVKQARTFLRPVKDRSCYFGDDFSFLNLSDIVTSLTVEVYGRKKTKSPLFGAEVIINDLPKNSKHEQKLDLGGGHSLRLELKLEDEIQLPAAEYTPLKNFFIIQATDALPFVSHIFKSFSESFTAVFASIDITQHRLQYKDMAKHLVRLWEQSDLAVKHLSQLTNLAIQKEDSVGTLFRGNSLASKCMDQYMKLIGMPFLQACIEEPIKELFESKAFFELDPSKGGKEENIKPLEYFLKRLVTSIFRQTAACPGKLAQVLKHIQESAISRFPENALVRYTAVSAFVFLRLICPAIINPKLFNMMPDFPCERTARNLTVAAKTLQNLANMTEFGVKETFMLPCNRFINAHRAKMQRFLDDITQSSSAPTPAIPNTETSDLASLLQICLTRKDDIALEAKKTESTVVATLPDILSHYQERIVSIQNDFA
eukprot:gene5601-181_t